MQAAIERREGEGVEGTGAKAGYVRSYPVILAYSTRSSGLQAKQQGVGATRFLFFSQSPSSNLFCGNPLLRLTLLLMGRSQRGTVSL